MLEYYIYVPQMNVSHYLNNISKSYPPPTPYRLLKMSDYKQFGFNADYVNIFLMH